jgi:sulfotransferase
MRESPTKEAKKLVLLSGLPRSGSTLLAGILTQNPNIHAGVSSPLFQILSDFVSGLTGNESGMLLAETDRERIARAIVREYLSGFPRRVVVDKHRAWNAVLPLMVRLFPDVVCVSCVRDVPEIVESFEKLAAAHPAHHMRLFPPDTRHSSQARVEHLVSRRGVIGASLQALADAWYGPHARRLLAIRYDSLVGDPARTMAAIYAHIQEPVFAHDFDRVEIDAPEFDAMIGAPGLHRVSGPVRRKPSERVLPPPLRAALHAQSLWDAEEDNPCGVKII